MQETKELLTRTLVLVFPCVDVHGESIRDRIAPPFFYNIYTSFNRVNYLSFFNLFSIQSYNDLIFFLKLYMSEKRDLPRAIIFLIN